MQSAHQAAAGPEGLILPLQVWYCSVKGLQPWRQPDTKNTRTNDKGGHTIWYDEPQLLQVVETAYWVCVRAQLHHRTAVMSRLAFQQIVHAFGWVPIENPWWVQRRLLQYMSELQYVSCRTLRSDLGGRSSLLQQT